MMLLYWSMLFFSFCSRLGGVTPCPTLCLCVEVGKVTCESTTEKLLAIPPSPPEGTSELFISDQIITRLARGDFVRYGDYLINLTIEASRLRTIEDGVFENLTNLIELHLPKNELMEVSQHTLLGLASLQSLYLHDNQGLLVQPCALSGLSILQNLGLWGTITSFESSLFVGTRCNDSVQLFHRNLRYLSADEFSITDLEQLQQLHELELHQIPSDVLNELDISHLSSLVVLSLNSLLTFPIEFLRHHTLGGIFFHSSYFTHLPANAFVGTPSIWHCRLVFGWLTYIHKDAFKGLPRLETLELYSNKIKTLPPLHLFEYTFPNLLLNLENNDIVCNCSLTWLFDSNVAGLVGGCNSPPTLADVSLNVLSSHNISVCTGGGGDDFNPILPLATTDDGSKRETDSVTGNKQSPVTYLASTQSTTETTNSKHTTTTLYVVIGAGVLFVLLLISGCTSFCWLRFSRATKGIREMDNSVQSQPVEEDSSAVGMQTTLDDRPYARDIPTNFGGPVDTYDYADEDPDTEPYYLTVLD